MRWLVAGLCLALASTFVYAANSTLPKPVQQALKKSRLSGEGLSIFVQDVNKQKPLLTFNADTPRNPASVIKVFTTFAALESLGPAYTWKTEAYLDGSLRGDTLNGNLVLKGYGDPFLTTEAYWKFLRALRDRGLRHITGDLVIDTTYFAPITTDRGTFDGKPNRAYNATPSALLVNFQVITFYIRPVDGKARVIADPMPANLVINNQVKVSKGRCRKRSISLDIADGGEISTVTVAGRLPASCGEMSLHRIVSRPGNLAFGVFKTLWQDMGGQLDGNLRLGTAPAVHPFYRQKSRTLAELIRGMNKFSNNVMTRQLLLTLGAERFGPPATTGKGRDAVNNWLAEIGLRLPELVLDNGAGLSRSARISARSLGQVLLQVQRSLYRPELLASLPIAATDGTLKRRFRNNGMAGRLRLKTGTLSGVRSIAGYALSRRGRNYAVVMLHNKPGVDKGPGSQVQNAFLEWLYEQ